MTTPTPLPFAPLTQHELNDRHERARMAAGRHVAAVFRVCNGEFRGQVDILRALSEEGDAYIAAARVRNGRSA